jgi:hypothetical protein
MEEGGSLMTRGWVFLALALFALVPLAAHGAGLCEDLGSNQTSASLLITHSDCQRLSTPPEAAAEAEKRHLLLLDITIKARS